MSTNKPIWMPLAHQKVLAQMRTATIAVANAYDLSPKASNLRDTIDGIREQIDTVVNALRNNGYDETGMEQ